MFRLNYENFGENFVFHDYQLYHSIFSFEIKAIINTQLANCERTYMFYEMFRQHFFHYKFPVEW